MTKEIWSKFKSNRIIDGKPRNIVVDICGDVINRNPMRDELKGLKKHLSVREIRKLPEQDIKEYFLEFLRIFYEKEGRVPTEIDFKNNPKYPNYLTYWRIFGSWNNAIRYAGLEVNCYPRKANLYTDEELLRHLILFYEENGRSPIEKDFGDNFKYPHYDTYTRRFGSWKKALKLVGLDVDSMAMKGILHTNQQKARLAEIFVRDHFAKKDKVIDLSGENSSRHPYDGICPNNQNYDVKSSKLYGHFGWDFKFYNVDSDEIEWYYLIAFNEDYYKLLHVWRIPACDLEYGENERLWISTNQSKSMEQYEITEKLIPVFKNWLNNIQRQVDGKIIIFPNVQYDKRLYDECIDRR